MSSIIKGLQNEQNDFQVNVPGYGTVPLEMLKRHVKELSKDFNGMIQSEEFIKAAYKTEQFYNALFALSKAMKAKSVEEGYSAGITGGSGLGIEKSPMEKVIEKPLGEGEVVSMQARKTPLVLAGNPFDWDIYDLRTGKVVANLLGGDRHDSPLYEIRINRNGLARDARMKPTYVATGDVNGDGPHGIYELAVPGKVDKIEKSPGPGGTTKLKPDAMDVVSHIAKGTGEGKYYGYDLVRVSDDDAYTWIEKVLGAKIMDVDDAMEAGYTDVDPEDPAGIIYTADQQDESYTAGLDEKINTPGGMGQSYRKFTPKSAGVDESKLNELSPETLARYKKAAGADATKADKEGDFKRGNKRFSGIVRATKKEFDKPKKESSIMKGLQNEGDTGVTRWSLDEDVITEGVLQKLAGLALGGLLAMGPSIAKADTVYGYLSPDTGMMKASLTLEKVPVNSKVIFAIDKDTNQITVIKGGIKGQEVKPDPSAVKQAQQGKVDTTAQAEPTTRQEKPNDSSQMGQSNFSLKGIKFGMTQQEVKEVAKKNNVATPLVNLGGGKESMSVNFNSILGVSSSNPSTLDLMGMSSDKERMRALANKGMPANLSFEEGKLVAITIGNDSGVITNLAQQLIAKFGKPTNIENKEWQNKAGAKFDNQIMYWQNANGASIKLAIRGSTRDDGYVVIADPAHLDKMTNAEIQKNTANLKDF